MKKMAGLFSKFSEAKQAVNAIYKAGYDADQVSILMRDTIVQDETPSKDTTKDVAKDAGIGAIGGGVLGGITGLLVGAGTITIPGLGPLIATGSFAAAIGTGLATGGVSAATGAIIGAMVSLGIPKKDAEIYAEGIKRGGVLVVVDTENQQVETIEQILNEAGAIDLKDLQEIWKDETWIKFNQIAIPKNKE